MYPTRTVYVVDDDHRRRAELVELLRASGLLLVGQSGDGDEAIERMSLLQPNLCLVAVTLRSSEVLSLIRKLRYLCPNTVVFATASHSEAARALEALGAGAAEVLLHPFGRRSLATSIARHLP